MHGAERMLRFEQDIHAYELKIWAVTATHIGSNPSIKA